MQAGSPLFSFLPLDVLRDAAAKKDQGILASLKRMLCCRRCRPDESMATPPVSVRRALAQKKHTTKIIINSPTASTPLVGSPVVSSPVARHSPPTNAPLRLSLSSDDTFGTPTHTPMQSPSAVTLELGKAPLVIPGHVPEVVNEIKQMPEVKSDPEQLPVPNQERLPQPSYFKRFCLAMRNFVAIAAPVGNLGLALNIAIEDNEQELKILKLTLANLALGINIGISSQVIGLIDRIKHFMYRNALRLIILQGMLVDIFGPGWRTQTGLELLTTSAIPIGALSFDFVKKIGIRAQNAVEGCKNRNNPHVDGVHSRHVSIGIAPGITWKKHLLESLKASVPAMLVSAALITSAEFLEESASPYFLGRASIDGMRQLAAMLPTYRFTRTLLKKLFVKHKQVFSPFVSLLASLLVATNTDPLSIFRMCVLASFAAADAVIKRNELDQRRIVSEKAALQLVELLTHSLVKNPKLFESLLEQAGRELQQHRKYHCWDPQQNALGLNFENLRVFAGLSLLIPVGYASSGLNGLLNYSTAFVSLFGAYIGSNYLRMNEIDFAAGNRLMRLAKYLFVKGAHHIANVSKFPLQSGFVWFLRRIWIPGTPLNNASLPWYLVPVDFLVFFSLVGFDESQYSIPNNTLKKLASNEIFSQKCVYILSQLSEETLMRLSDEFINFMSHLPNTVDRTGSSFRYDPEARAKIFLNLPAKDIRLLAELLTEIKQATFERMGLTIPTWQELQKNKKPQSLPAPSSLASTVPSLEVKTAEQPHHAIDIKPPHEPRERSVSTVINLEAGSAQTGVEIKPEVKAPEQPHRGLERKPAPAKRKIEVSASSSAIVRARGPVWATAANTADEKAASLAKLFSASPIFSRRRASLPSAVDIPSEKRPRRHSFSVANADLSIALVKAKEVLKQEISVASNYAPATVDVTRGLGVQQYSMS